MCQEIGLYKIYDPVVSGLTSEQKIEAIVVLSAQEDDVAKGGFCLGAMDSRNPWRCGSKERLVRCEVSRNSEGEYKDFVVKRCAFCRLPFNLIEIH